MWKIPDTDMIGTRYGALVVSGGSVIASNNDRFIECACDCGVVKLVRFSSLRVGETKSCGCLRRKMSAKANSIHGHAKRPINGKTGKSPEYRAWMVMKDRCYRPRHISYKWYGMKGISVAEEWRNSFIAFFDHIGQRPSPNHSIDRYPNPKGNYEPGNVRWATRKEQNRNLSKNRNITYEGKTLTIAEWAEVTGMKYSTLYSRIIKGIEPSEALTVKPGMMLNKTSAMKDAL